MLMVVCMIVGILLAIINRYSPSEWSKIPEAEDKTNSRDSFTVNNALFFVHTTVCWQGKRGFLTEIKVLKVLTSLFWVVFFFYKNQNWSINLILMQNRFRTIFWCIFGTQESILCHLFANIVPKLGPLLYGIVDNNIIRLFICI